MALLQSAVCLEVIARAFLAYRSWPMSELLVALLLIARRLRAISGWAACLSHDVNHWDRTSALFHKQKTYPKNARLLTLAVLTLPWIKQT